MRVRHPNPRLVTSHRNYSVEDIARLFGVHKNTVRDWLKLGLAAIDDRRPMLILGRERCRSSCTSADRRPSRPAGRVGFFASHAARPRYRPGRWRTAPLPALWPAACAASAPTAAGSSTGGPISRKTMPFEASWRSRSRSPVRDYKRHLQEVRAQARDEMRRLLQDGGES